ncbi:MAG: response regulator [Spirochaetales bacterium]
MYDNILIVDDSETSRMIIKKCLLMSGHEAASYWEAEDGIKAMSILGSHPVDLVVTDLNMPRMDGLTLVRKLRKGDATRELKVVVISSMGNQQIDSELQNLGVFSIIRKPVTPAKILQAVGAETGSAEGGEF